MAGIMIQGTTSDAGKSAMVTGLCRALYRRGLRVAPFKPQNMALNSAVTVEGGEIGRSQAVQARACGLEPSVDMNPVLLKPNTDTGAQVIVGGRAIGNREARGYHELKPALLDEVLAAYRRLAVEYDAVIVEGAGSPAEINLRENDIANMGFAEAADCPVLLVGDIDRGGVFAQFVGTLALLSPSERERITGFLINRFRGDPALLEPGLHQLFERTRKPALGVVPYLQGLYLEAEDALSHPASTESENAALRVVVPALPRISNHTDFDALRLQPGVTVEMAGPDRTPPPSDLIILPGSKSVRSDLAWLRAQGWEEHIHRHLRYGGKVIGICGGYQMLGRAIADPEGIEGPAGISEGLGLLNIDTELAPDKTLTRVSGQLRLDGHGVADVTGYEIHAGRTSGVSRDTAPIRIGERPDGAVSDDGRIVGTYLHGVFDHAGARELFLKWAGMKSVTAVDHDALREAGIDRLADAIESGVDMDRILACLDLDSNGTGFRSGALAEGSDRPPPR